MLPIRLYLVERHGVPAGALQSLHLRGELTRHDIQPRKGGTRRGCGDHVVHQDRHRLLIKVTSPPARPAAGSGSGAGIRGCRALSLSRCVFPGIVRPVAGVRVVRGGLRFDTGTTRFAAAEVTECYGHHGHDQHGEQARDLAAVAAGCTPSCLATNADLLGRICRWRRHRRSMAGGDGGNCPAEPPVKQRGARRLLLGDSSGDDRRLFNVRGHARRCVGVACVERLYLQQCLRKALQLVAMICEHLRDLLMRALD